MKRVSASAAERSLLVNGDSLAEGTRPYIPPERPGGGDDGVHVSADGYRARAKAAARAARGCE